MRCARLLSAWLTLRARRCPVAGLQGQFPVDGEDHGPRGPWLQLVLPAHQGAEGRVRQGEEEDGVRREVAGELGGEVPGAAGGEQRARCGVFFQYVRHFTTSSTRQFKSKHGSLQLPGGERGEYRPLALWISMYPPVTACAPAKHRHLLCLTPIFSQSASVSTTGRVN